MMESTDIFIYPFETEHSILDEAKGILMDLFQSEFNLDGVSSTWMEYYLTRASYIWTFDNLLLDKIVILNSFSMP